MPEISEQCSAQDIFRALVQEQEANDKNAQIACDTIAELSKDKERLTAELTELQAKHVEAILLLNEANDNLHHTECMSNDALNCRACSLESRIDSAIDSTPQSVTNLLAVLEAAKEYEKVFVSKYHGIEWLNMMNAAGEKLILAVRKWTGEKP